MKRLLMIAAALAVVMSVAQPLHAETQTWFGFQVGISGGTPAPPIVFRTEPHAVMVNDVYVVDDPRCGDDVFRADNLYWRLRGGYWYRSASWGGPWVAVDVRRVPERVLVVPARHWKHHPRYEAHTVVVEHYDNGRHRGEGHGHGHGHGHNDHDDD